MLLLQSLPTSIGVAAIAPALLVLWLVIAADERPGPPARVWLAFVLGAASISLLGIARVPFAAILAVPGNPWLTQGLRSVFGVAAPEEIVKVLVIIAVSMRRRTFLDPMDTVVYGAAAGLGFAAYENLAYLVQHADMWRSLAALRSVLTVPFHGALGIIAGAYIAIARAGTALGANRHHRDWSRISSWALALFAPVALHAAFDFPLLILQKHPDLSSTIRLLLVAGGGAGFAGVAFLLTSIHHWFVNPERNVSLVLIPLGFTSILIGLALLVVTTAIYIFGRNRIRTAAEGFSSAPGPG
jgi:protease PrsW